MSKGSAKNKGQGRQACLGRNAGVGRSQAQDADDPHPNTASHPVLNCPYRHLWSVCTMSSGNPPEIEQRV